MRYTKPDFYDQFRCVASECPETCCAGWEICIDEETMEKYKALQGPFSNRLKNGIDERRDSFLQYEGNCNFLNEEKLCDLYTEIGEEYMCETCRTYPRHIEEYGQEKELSLGISCPEVARIVISRKEPLKFISVEVEESAEEYEFDQELYEFLKEAREVIFLIAQNRQYTISTRMGLVLALSHDLQARIDTRAFEDGRHVLERYQKKKVQQYLIRKIRKIKREGKGELKGKRRLVRQFGGLVFLHGELETAYYDLIELLAMMKKHWYEENRLSFTRQLDLRYGDTYREQLLMYFLYMNVNTAVYDEELFGKVKMAVACSLMIEELNFKTWMLKRKLTRDDLIRNAYLFARTLEHSEENIELLETVFNKKKNSLQFFLQLL